MITNLSSYTTPVQAERRTNQPRPYHPIPFSLQNSRNNSIYPTYPTIYPNLVALQRDGTSIVRRTSVQQEALSRAGRMTINESRASIELPESIRYDTPPTAEQPIKSESVAERRAAAVSRAGTNLEVENEVERIRSHLSSANENVNQFEYNNTDDQFYYFEPDKQAPTSQAAIDVNNRTAALREDLNDLNDLNAKHDAGSDDESNHIASNDQTDDQRSEHNLETLSIDQLQSKAGHDQKKKSIDEFNETYEDYRRNVKKIGYDYNYYNS